MCDTCSEHNGDHVHAPEGYSKTKIVKEGKEEAERFGNKLERNPKPDYLVRWRAYTKDFTEAEWDELTRRLLIQ